VIERVVGDVHHATESAFVDAGAFEQLPDVLGAERLQLEHQRARQQRSDDGEGGVFGRRRDEQHDPVLHGGEQRILLGLREPVDLVDEQHRLLAVGEAAARHIDDRTHVLHTGGQSRERFEPPACRTGDQ